MRGFVYHSAVVCKGLIIYSLSTLKASQGWGMTNTIFLRISGKSELMEGVAKGLLVLLLWKVEDSAGGGGIGGGGD